MPFRFWGLCAEQRPQLLAWMAGHVDVVRMDVCGHTAGRHTVHATDMVDVPMCHEERYRREIMIGQKSTDSDRIRWGVDDDRWPSRVRSHNIRVRAEVPKGAGFDQHLSSLPRSEYKAVCVVHGFDVSKRVEHQFERFPVRELDLIAQQRDPVAPCHR